MYLAQEKTEALIVCRANNTPLRYRTGEVLRIALNDGNIRCFRLLIGRSGQTILPPGIGPDEPGKVYRIIGRYIS